MMLARAVFTWSSVPAKVRVLLLADPAKMPFASATVSVPLCVGVKVRA